ncbi:MAG: dimethylsulfonioproprionate lyase family protein [Pseudomonadota bacterium]
MSTDTTADQRYDRLLTELRRAYEAHPQAQAFAPFPDDVRRQPLEPHHCPCADYLEADSALVSRSYAPLQQAIIAASPVVQWRETYKDTDIGADFMDRFGCYSVIGAGGPFTSDTLWVWVVYMPAGLDYPRHHHPGEELYIVISGEAEFRRDGAARETLREGDTVLHASNQPHATQTFAHPVLCLVIWRNGFDTAPVLTPERSLRFGKAGGRRRHLRASSR